VTDAVTDAAGASLISDARRVVVAYPGGGGGVPLTPATASKLGGIKVGARLTVQADGTLSADAPDLSSFATRQDIAGIVGAAPAALDTLEELARQLQADEVGTAAMLATLTQHTQQLATKADLVSGKLKPSQAPGVGFGLSFDTTTNKYSYTGDSPLNFNAGDVVKRVGYRVNPANGQLEANEAYTTYYNVTISSGQRYRSNVPLYYAALYQESTFVLPWAVDTQGPKQSTDSQAYTQSSTVVARLYLWVSVLNTQLSGLRIVPFSSYDDSALTARVTKLEQNAGTGTGGGGGTVKTVNNVAPDANGNVTIAVGGNGSGATYTPGAGIAISAANVISSSVATGTGTVLTFTQDTEYNPIYSGTFTVDLTDAKVGTVVFAYLGPAATKPDLNSSFQLLAGNFSAGVGNMYAFKVSANGKIQYYITLLN
jgi:hypothetical protein